jgi:hypothetical protein
VPSDPFDGRARPRCTGRSVAAYADQKKAVVVNANAKDFAKLIARRPVNNKQPFRFAGRITLKCKPDREAQRLKQLMPRLLVEAAHSASDPDKRLIVDVFDDYLRIDR